jgi:RNA polymerase sigma factor (TIGR02999 family)
MQRDDITPLLRRWSEGDAAASEELTRLLYDELRAQAQRYLRRERIDHTLQPTALVHETYLRLVGGSQPEWRNRAHFLAVAARVGADRPCP